MKRYYTPLFHCLLICALCYTNNTALVADEPDRVVEGLVLDAQTREAIPGASVRIVESRRGTYSHANGAFRLPVLKDDRALSVQSLGYARLDTTLPANSELLRILLQPVAIQTPGVEVNAPISANEVVQRAIDNKEANRAKVKTFNGLLYSKFVFDLEGNVFGNIEDKDRQQIRETFSRVFRDNERDVSKVTILQRRQTANVSPDQNLLAIGNFISFYRDEIEFLNAHIPSPLSIDAFSFYKYTLKERQQFGKQTAWVIDFVPQSELFPAFTGSMTIIEDGYNLVDIRVRPSASTSIRYVSDLYVHQKFNEAEPGVWTPSYLHAGGRGGVKIVAGIAEVNAGIDVTSFYSEMEVNTTLPDSVYGNEERIFSVAPHADSIQPEFWANNSMTVLSEREQKMYHRVDSLVQEYEARNPASEREAALRFDYAPFLVFNRVSGLMPTLSPEVFYGPLKLDGRAAYAFGMKKALGTARLSFRMLTENNFDLNLRGSLFSDLGLNPGEETFFEAGNSISAALFNRDHWDYYRKDGWKAELFGTYGNLLFNVNGGVERHFALENNTDRGFFDSPVFRENPTVAPGTFSIFRSTLQWGYYDVNLMISTNPSTDVRAKLDGLYGEHRESGQDFRTVSAKVRLSQPTFYTGYNPMTLQLAVEAGIADENTPPQYQFVLANKLRLFGRFDQFFSAPTGFYGGTEYLALRAEHNFSDILWRWAGLPLFEGRGLEFIIHGGSAYFDQKALNGYVATGNQWYSELGVGIGKIPVIISNVLFLRFDYAWGIGPLGSGRTGYTFTLSSPF